MCCFFRKNGCEVSKFIFIFLMNRFLLFEFDWASIWLAGEQDNSFLDACIIKLVAADLPLCYSTNDTTIH